MLALTKLFLTAFLSISLTLALPSPWHSERKCTNSVPSFVYGVAGYNNSACSGCPESDPSVSIVTQTPSHQNISNAPCANFPRRSIDLLIYFGDWDKVVLYEDSYCMKVSNFTLEVYSGDAIRCIKNKDWGSLQFVPVSD